MNSPSHGFHVIEIHGEFTQKHPTPHTHLSNHKLISDKEIDWSQKENQSSLSQLMIEDLSGKNLLRNRINPESVCDSRKEKEIAVLILRDYFRRSCFREDVFKVRKLSFQDLGSSR